MTKKFISLVLSLALLIGLVPTMSVSAESTVVTHFAEDFETWAEGTKFNENSTWKKATIYINSAGDASQSSVTNCRFITGLNIKAEVVNVPGYDGELTNAFKYELRSDATWKTKFAESNYAGASLRFQPTVALPQSDATLVYDFKVYIPADTDISHDIQKFSFGPIVKIGDDLCDGTNSATYTYVAKCATLSTGWNKITAVVVPYTRDTILYLNDECVGYKKYAHNGDITSATYDNALYVNSYQVTDWEEKYIILDDYNIYSVPNATTASSAFSNATEIPVNAKPTVEFTQKVLGKVINSDGSVSDCATIEFTNMSDGTQVDIAGTSISQDGKTLTITPAASLKKGVQYKVTVSDVKDMYDQTVEACEFTFTTVEPEEIVVSATPTFTKENLFEGTNQVITQIEDGYINASFTFENKGASAQPVIILAVLKDEGAIKAFQFEQGTIPSAETLTFNGGFHVDDYINQSIEVYVWDSLSNMKPLLADKYGIDKDGKFQE